MSEANDQMLEMFLFEMNSLIEQLDEILLNSEKNGELTENDVNEIFRIMHTVKGSSAMMDFDVISTVTHHLEDAFFVIRENNGIDPNHFTELFDLMLDATDFLKSQLEIIQNGTAPSDISSNEELIQRAKAFKAMLTGESAPAPAPPPAKVEAPANTTAPTEVPASTAAPTEAPAPAAPAGSGGSLYHIEVFFEEDCGMENLRAFMLVNTLKEQCAILGYEPADIETNQESGAEIMMNGFHVTLESSMGEDALQELVEAQMHVRSVNITALEHLGPAKISDGNASGESYSAHIRFEEDSGMENLRAFMLVNSLRQKNCRVFGFSPPDIESNSNTAAVIQEGGFTIELETSLTMQELQAQLEGSMHVRSAVVSLMPKAASARAESAVQPAPAEKPSPAPAPSAAQPAEDSAPEESAAKPAAAKPIPASNKPIKQNLINVSLSKLDELMDLMGELVITNSMVIHSPDLKGVDKLDNFNKSARQLLKLTDELQDMVMSIRMVPVAGTFQKMQRIVRDMCRNLGKDCDLITMGEETDIDKTIIDGIADPIMHLVRNSMDHGIEMPEKREAAGKSRRGIITLSAQNTGGEILITVSDDGRGLDADKLLEKAKHNGILTKPASEYTEKEAFMLLCAPGFSTKEQVTEYSGRGVGMDVVKKNIEKIGGTVIIESKKGQGMSVFLKIPLTLAIVDGMDVTVGGGIYTLQITSINESFKPTRDQLIVDTNGNEMIMIRGDVFPIIRLHDLYNVPNAITDIEDGILIWVQSGDQSACLFVDQLVGEQQIVVKPLPAYLKRYDIKSMGISGCTILGDGNISLILDVGSIIDKVTER